MKKVFIVTVLLLCLVILPSFGLVGCGTKNKQPSTDVNKDGDTIVDVNDWSLNPFG